MNVSLILGRYSLTVKHPAHNGKSSGSTPDIGTVHWHYAKARMWHVSWHDGFGGTHTADTPNPFVFRRSLGHVDWFEIDGFGGLTLAQLVV